MLQFKLTFDKIPFLSLTKVNELQLQLCCCDIQYV